MKIEKFQVQSCCGKTSITFKIDRPVTEDLIAFLKKEGFSVLDHYMKAGILYATNMDFIVTSPLGANKLHITCKTGNCSEKINDLEGLLTKME
jgi:hypothetical protein